MKYNLHNAGGEVLNLDGPLDRQAAIDLAKEIETENDIEVKIIEYRGPGKDVFLSQSDPIEFHHHPTSPMSPHESWEYWQMKRGQSQFLPRDQHLKINGVRYWGPGKLTRIDDESGSSTEWKWKFRLESTND